MQTIRDAIKIKPRKTGKRFAKPVARRETTPLRAREEQIVEHMMKSHDPRYGGR